MSNSLRVEPSADVPLSIALVRALAERTDADALELDPPLESSVDTDALNAMFGSDAGLEGRLVFAHAGHRVTVFGDGSFDITALDR